MRAFRLLALPLLLFPCALFTPAQDDMKPAAAQTQASESANAESKVVYVSDFDLDVPNAAKEDKSSSAGSSAPAVDSKKDDGPAQQARELVDLMSTTIVKELQRAGYTARRLRPGEARPAEGVGIRGVFAEPDEQNRLRRAVIGTISGTGKMELFVGVSNLTRPEQALYALADPKNSDNKPGPVITVSSYAPVAKFEIPKQVTEKAVKDTASAITADLTSLLNSNIAALTR